MSTSDDAEIIDKTNRSGWSDRLKSAKQGEYETIYDPYRCYTAWITVPDSMWVVVEE